MSHVGERLAEKRKSRLGVVLSAGPAAKRGSIGQAVGIFERRRRLLPGTMLHQAPPQCLTARQQTVMGVRERKQWEESEGLPATTAATAPNPNPVVVCIVRLLAAASLADDRLPLTNRASPQDFVAVLLPLRFKLVRRRRKWDKENRSRWGSACVVFPCCQGAYCQSLRPQSRRRFPSSLSARPQGRLICLGPGPALSCGDRRRGTVRLCGVAAGGISSPYLCPG